MIDLTYMLHRFFMICPLMFSFYFGGGFLKQNISGIYIVCISVILHIMILQYRGQIIMVRLTRVSAKGTAEFYNFMSSQTPYRFKLTIVPENI